MAVGKPEAQAEVQAEALSDVVIAQLATKDDLRQAVSEVRGEMREMELRLRAHIESELRKQMIWYFTMQVALVGAVIAVLKLI